ncbi:hypothetical protein C0995_016423, partial [Termitomyces sp. Mi166
AAAGNDATYASLYSPGHAPSAITVAASNIMDYQTSFSNYEVAVDIFAPGEDIVSAGISNEKATAVMSGTSMSTAYVSGLVATYLGISGPYTAEEMKDMLFSVDLDKVLCNVCK